MTPLVLSYDNSQRGLWLILLAAMMWGTVGVASQSLYANGTTNPLSISFFRLALAAPALLIAAWWVLRERLFQITRGAMLLMMGIGVLIAWYQATFFVAVRYTGVTIATLVTICTTPLIVAVGSVMMKQEVLTRRLVLALMAALLGTVMLVGLRSDAQSMPQMGLGVAFALGSALGYAGVILGGRMLPASYHPLQVTSFGFTIGAVILLIVCLFTGFAGTYSAQGWLVLGYLGLLPTALAYGMFLFGMRSTLPTVASIVALAEPLTAAVLAWIVLGEKLTAMGLIGAGLMLGSLIVLTKK
jgi:drug/metabolite transporter, DME family